MWATTKSLPLGATLVSFDPVRAGLLLSTLTVKSNTAMAASEAQLIPWKIMPQVCSVVSDGRSLRMYMNSPTLRSISPSQTRGVCRFKLTQSSKTISEISASVAPPRISSIKPPITLVQRTHIISLRGTGSLVRDPDRFSCGGTSKMSNKAS